jgi:trans-2,3-dihydro-3-hydroxyanthranilate isomerase
MSSARRFVTLDVFTDRRFAGNPLAIVLDGEGLEDVAMQAIAREFNLPETVFVSTARDTTHRARLRIFTPAVELPFAGHPTIGTAVLLGCLDGRGGELLLEERIGPVRCHVTPHGADRGQAQFATPKLPARGNATVDPALAGSALGLAPEDIGFAGYRLEQWSAGLSFVFVPLRSREAIARCRPDLNLFEQAFSVDGPGRAYVFCRETVEAGRDFHVRMFAPAMGIAEDPATGSAAAAFAGLIASHEKLREGEHRFLIEQGYEMGRPSLVEISVAIANGVLAGASVGGSAIIVSEGTIRA